MHSVTIGRIMKRDVNVKGRAYYQNLKTKFLTSAKEAALSGDRILSEYNLQIAEHYARVISERFNNPREQKQPQDQVRQIIPEKIDEKSKIQQSQDVPVYGSTATVVDPPEGPVKPMRVRRFRSKSSGKTNPVENANIPEKFPDQEPAAESIIVVKKRSTRKRIVKDKD
ncbi:MAG: DUF4167 domain-containing protein [Holosporales bacterium]|jgi:hypothetical protein|nr:DUF4167 domain-containing protein [Holosporales bacterium]